MSYCASVDYGDYDDEDDDDDDDGDDAGAHDDHPMKY